jgi:PAS domain S-box-containing protein
MNLVARTALAVGLVSSLLLGVLGVAGYLVVRDRTLQAEQAKAEVKAQGVAVRLETRLRQAVQSVDALARNLVIRNALLDSVGRETYVQPILNGVAQIDGQPVSLSLVDFQGRGVIEAGTEIGAAPDRQAWLRSRIESGTPGARVIDRDGQPYLVVVAYPVVVPNTRSVEGAMAIRVSTDALLAGLRIEGKQYSLTSAASAARPAGFADGSASVDVALQLPAPLDQLGLTLRAQPDRSGAEQALAQLQVQYLALGLASVMALVMLSVFAARRVTEPIRSLAAEAQRISAQAPDQAMIAVPASASGEVAVLAQALGQMLARLRTAAEAQRHGLETQFRAIFDPSPIGMTLADTGGAGMHANRAFLTMMGYSAEELQQLNYMSITHPDDRARNLELLTATVAGRLPGYRYEKRLQRKSGEYIWVVVVTSPLRDQQGGVTGVVSQVEDITERKRAEQALRDSEERYRRAERGTNDGLWDWNIATGEDYLSPRWLAMLGYQPGELPYRRSTVLDMIHPDDKARVDAAVEAQLRHGRLYDLEMRLRCKSGDYLWVQTRAEAERDAQGQAVRMSGSITDIGQRKQAEEQIRAALRDKELLLKEIYHRVKNNLQVIASLLNLQGRNDHDGNTRALLEDSANRVKSMALVHEQLYQGGDLSSIDFAAYLGQLVRHLADAHGAAGQRVPIRLDVAPVQLGIETAVPLGLIINELLSNAYKHAYPGERGGEVVLRLAVLDDGHIEVIVSDHGVGLPPGLRPETVTSLGLRLVASLTEQLEGALECGPNGASGSRFTVRFKPAMSELKRLPA